LLKLRAKSYWHWVSQPAGLSVGRARQAGERSAGWETRDAADGEVCGTEIPRPPPPANLKNHECPSGAARGRQGAISALA